MRRSLASLALVVALLVAPAFAQVEGDFSQGGGIRVGDSTTACGGTIEGAIRYDSDSGKVLAYCNGTSWLNLTTGGGTPAAPDRGIQINNGGAFFASSGLVYSSVGTFVVSNAGGQSNGWVPVTGAGTRMIFVPGKSGAFRVGGIDVFAPNNWDASNIGENSIGMGWNNLATNYGSVAIGRLAYSYGPYSYALGNQATSEAGYSFAIGDGATTKGDHGIALGNGTMASGIDSIAIGRAAMAGNGTGGNGQGDGSMAVNLVDDAVTLTTAPKVTGIQSLGIFMGDQDGGITLATNNQLSLLGGKMVIDSTVPATNLSADAELEIDGTLKISSGGEACDAAREGSIQYLAATDTFEVCKTAGSWTNMQDTTPVGVVLPYAGSSAPTGWLLCYGQAVSRATYSALFSAIGTTYGAGDGSTTFNLPDLRGRVVAGDDDMGGTAASRLTNSGTGNPGINGATLGAAGGMDRMTLTAAQSGLPAHTHTASTTALANPANLYIAGAGSDYGVPYTAGAVTVNANGAAGASQAHPIVQPTIVLSYIIRY